MTCGNGVTQTRTYTVQGWLRNISATKAGGSLLFSETLRYWDSSSATPLYGGVISGTETRNGTSSAIAYDLTYDYLWRLTQVKRPGSNRWAEKGIAYDRNGNISSLKRYGYGGTVTDNLAMAYDGDRLTSVSSGGDVWSYGHDGSGRMTCDGRLEGMTVTYGLTGLLQRTSDPASGADTWYSYLADGTRLGTAQKTGSAATDCDGFLTLGGMNLVHSGSQVSFESSVFGEGVILADGVKYFVRDHLGNTRVVTDGSGSVVERDDYYAFGQRHPYTSHPLLDASRWRFAGKEIQPLGGTGWLDFGARQYDSFIGRWTTMDPLAEKYPSVSPYAYCAGNPVMFVDDGGRDLVIFGANNSSVTFTTDLINLSVRAGGIGIDWKGNHRLDGGETLSAALDLAGLFDPSGIADGTNAVLLASEGRYWDALQSSVSVLPLGDIAKAGRVGKDIGIISEAIGVAVHKHHVIPRAVYRDNAYVLKGVLKKDSAENLLQLPAGFHGNHPAYNKWIQRQILDKTNGNRPLTIEELDVIKRNASREINRALDAYKNGSGLNLNKHFKNLTE